MPPNLDPVVILLNHDTNSMGASMRAGLLIACSLIATLAGGCAERPPDKPKPGTGIHNFSSSSTFGSPAQTDGSITNISVLGDVTPPNTDGSDVQNGAGYQNRVGIMAVQH